jgi:DNA-binding transcriptional LysR family regulator
MTLDQLRIFLAVAEREHMTLAAADLRLTQSAVSGAVQALEARYKVSLFNRIGRRIELSPDGRAFLDHARSVLRAAETAARSLAELRGLKRGLIALHASQTTGAYWLPQRLARFHAAHPDIEIRLSLGNTDQVADAVNSGLAEIGFVEGQIRHTTLVTEEVGADQLEVVVATGHPWPSRLRLGRRQILEAAWILRERGSGTRSVFENALRKLGIDPAALNVTLELPSNEAIREAVESGAGATAISRFVVRSALRLKTLRQVRFVPLQRPYVLLRHPERTLSQAASAFHHFILDYEKTSGARSRADA